MAYDGSTGARLWVARYNGPDGSYDAATALRVSPDGSMVFVTGESYASNETSDYATVAYDASTGAELWAARYDGPASQDDHAAALGVTADGSMVFVTGYSYGRLSTGHDYATAAYDASTGAELWVKRYNGPGDNYDEADALDVSPDGSKVFVTGDSYGSNDTNYATVAYDASTGTRLWVRQYNGPANSGDDGRALGLSPDGSTVFVTGESYGSTSLYDYATVAYDASTGTRLWVRRYNGPGNSYDDGRALGVSLDRSTVFVTGESYGSTGTYDYATVAYSIS